MNYIKRSWIIVALMTYAALNIAAQSPRDASNNYARAVEYYLRGDFTNAVRLFTRVIDAALHVDPPSSQRALPGQMNLSAAGDSGGITFIDPLTALAYANRALARVRLGDSEGAVSDCDRALSINPGLVIAYRNRGLLHWLQGRLDEAISDLSTVLRKTPRDAEAFGLRGNIYVDKGELDSALADFNQAIHLDSRRPGFYCDRAWVFIRTDQFEPAQADLDRAVALNPQFAPAHGYLGVLAYKRNDYDRAISESSRSIELNPREVIPYGIRGLAELHVGKQAEAQKDFAECLRREPGLKPNIDLSLRNEKLLTFPQIISNK
jgi:tetratricopeptide (TPR) repeat protein